MAFRLNVMILLNSGQFEYTKLTNLLNKFLGKNISGENLISCVRFVGSSNVLLVVSIL